MLGNVHSQAMNAVFWQSVIGLVDCSVSWAGSNAAVDFFLALFVNRAILRIWRKPVLLSGQWRKPATFCGKSRRLMHRIRLGIAALAPFSCEAKPPRSCEGQDGEKTRMGEGGVKRSYGTRRSYGARRSCGTKRQVGLMVFWLNIIISIIITKTKQTNIS